MARYIARRLLLMIVVLVGVTLLAFLMLRIIPGDPCRAIHGELVPAEVIDNCRAEHGFDRPIWEQYATFIKGVLQGDLGTSLFYRRPAMEVLLERLPVTMFLVVYAAFLSLLIALPLATWAALKRDSWVDQAIRTATTVAISMPRFWTGLLLILLFSIRLDLFPVSGYGKTFWQHLYYLFLPSLTIAISMAGLLARNLRSSILEVIQADYVRTARSKGLRGSTIFLRHVLRNGMISTVTLFGLNIAWMVGGTVLVEIVFAIPGVGSLLLQSIFTRDYDLVQNTTLIFAVIVMVVTLLTDLTYPLLDPRVRYD